MMWKTLILLAVTSIVLAGKLNKHHSNYAFQIHHDYNYLKHHEKLNHHKHETEQEPQENEAAEQGDQEDKKEEHHEEIKDEAEQTNDSDDSNAESEESENDEEHKNKGYEFYYKVLDSHSHDKKGQHEKKHDGEIKGVYWLLQPDGYKRTVDYHADKHNGFHAKVDYSKQEESNGEEEDSKPKSEYYVKTYQGHKKDIPVKEEQEDGDEQDKQQESAINIPIYVI